MKTVFVVLCSFIVIVAGFSEACAGTVNTLVISEVLYDPDGGDDGFEWIELFNGTTGAIDLSEWSLGWGGSDYTYGTLQLTGTINPESYFVVGGPESDSSNGSPSYSLAFDWKTNLQNSGDAADGVALFHTLATAITADAVPFFSVIYGGSNSNSLMDPAGSAGVVDVGDAPSGSSIAFSGTAEGWEINPNPNPGSGSLSTVPIPSAIWFLGSGLLGLVGIGRRKTKQELL